MPSNKLPKQSAQSQVYGACTTCKHAGRLISNKAPINVRPCNTCKQEFHPATKTNPAYCSGTRHTKG